MWKDKSVREKIQSIVKHALYGIFISAIVLLAYWLSKSGILEQWVARSEGSEFIAVFLAGIFFTSFSTFPLTLALLNALAETPVPTPAIALLAGLGAMIGDAGLLSTLRASFLDDISAYLVRLTHGAFEVAVGQKLVKILAFLLGGIVIASPLPDELGLSLMGIAHIPTRYILLVSYIFNVLGVAAIVLAARAL